MSRSSLDFVTSLCDELTTSGKGAEKLSEVIIKSVSIILKLQSTVTKRECRANILKRGVDKGVILERNVSINCIVTDLLSDKYSNREDVLKLQHTMYRSEMEIKIGSVGREITVLNSIIAKERRTLKAITTDEMFKSINVFLQKMKTDEMIALCFDNEQLWKRALCEKEEQTKSIDGWVKMVNAISIDKYCGDKTVSKNYGCLVNLSISKMMIDSIDPEELNVEVKERGPAPTPSTVIDNVEMTDPDVIDLSSTETNDDNTVIEIPSPSNDKTVENENPFKRRENVIERVDENVQFSKDDQPRRPTRREEFEKKVQHMNALNGHNNDNVKPFKRPIRRSFTRDRPRELKRRAYDENFHYRRQQIRPYDETRRFIERDINRFNVNNDFRDRRNYR